MHILKWLLALLASAYEWVRFGFDWNYGPDEVKYRFARIVIGAPFLLFAIVISLGAGFYSILLAIHIVGFFVCPLLNGCKPV